MTYTYRFCRICNQAVQELLSDEGRECVYALVRFGRYECPFHKEQCGRLLTKPNVKVIEPYMIEKGGNA